VRYAGGSFLPFCAPQHSNQHATLPSKNNCNRIARAHTRTHIQPTTTPHVCTRIGHAGVVRQLLEAGAGIEARDQEKRTPLTYASIQVGAWLAWGSEILLLLVGRASC